MSVRLLGATEGNEQSTHPLSPSVFIEILFYLQILRPNHSSIDEKRFILLKRCLNFDKKNNILCPKSVFNSKITGLPEFSTPKAQ